MSPAISAYPPQLLAFERSVPGTKRTTTRLGQSRHLRTSVLVYGNAMLPFLRTAAEMNRHLRP